MTVCALQGRFIVDADVVRPGRTFWSDELFDIVQNIGGTRGDGPFYNVPGFPDNFKVDAAAGMACRCPSGQHVEAAEGCWNWCVSSVASHAFCLLSPQIDHWAQLSPKCNPLVSFSPTQAYCLPAVGGVP